MIAESIEQPYWYAIQTRSRHEKVVRDQLAAKSIAQLLPLWRKRSIWKDRVKIIDVPLFSGYLFGYFALQDRIAVLETIGVARIVGINGKPVPIPDEQIAAVRTMMEHRLPCSPHPYLVEGMRVRIKCGLLAGAEGILIARKQRHRLVISLDLIQQAVAIDVDSAEVEPLDFHPQGLSKLASGSS
jgi:transcription antitermination factor NusG